MSCEKQGTDDQVTVLCRARRMLASTVLASFGLYDSLETGA